MSRQGPFRAPGSEGARPGFVPAGRGGMPICGACGAIASSSPLCELCGAAGAGQENAAPRPDGAYWAQLRTELVCRSCGQRSPVDPLDVDGTVTCGHCNAMQAFDVSAWSDALEHAHDVADLAGVGPAMRDPRLEGRNPFEDVGGARAAVPLSIRGTSEDAGVVRTRNLEVVAAPGVPLCASCASPLDVAVSGGDVRARCVGCGETSHYRVDPRALSMEQGLVAVLGEDLRVDRPEARLESTSHGQVIALRCPSCGGVLEAQPGVPSSTCTYCKAQCRIPQRTLLALKRSGAPTAWWALFTTPSSKRDELVDRLADEAQGRIERAPIDESREAKMIPWALQIAVPLVVIAIVGAVLFPRAILGWLQGRLSYESAPVVSP